MTSDDSNRRDHTNHAVERAIAPIDYSPASGAVDPEHAAQDASERIATGRHGYTENATFTREPMPAASGQWETLNEINRFYFADAEKSRGSEQHRQDQVNDTEAWGRQIGLTSIEIERAAQLVLDADAGWKRNHGTPTVILAALTLAANEGTTSRDDVRKEIRPQMPLATESSALANTYGRIRNELGVDPTNVRDCRQHLRQFL